MGEFSNKMEKKTNKTHHTVGTVPNSNSRKKQAIPLTNTYMISHFPGSVESLQ